MPPRGGHDVFFKRCLRLAAVLLALACLPTPSSSAADSSNSTFSNWTCSPDTYSSSLEASTFWNILNMHTQLLSEKPQHVTEVRHSDDEPPTVQKVSIEELP